MAKNGREGTRRTWVIGQKPVVVRKTEKLGERERKALYPSTGKGNDDDDDEHF